MRSLTARPRRALAGLVGLTLGLTLLVAPATATTAARGDRVPSDQPLPGYTVDNPPLAPLTVRGRSTRVF
ncbi:hypothetical protein [Nocardioides marmoraquaticus]